MFFCKKTPRFSRGAHNWGACAFRAAHITGAPVLCAGRKPRELRCAFCVAHMTGAQDWFLPELLPGDVDLGAMVDDVIDVQQEGKVVGV